MLDVSGQPMYSQDVPTNCLEFLFSSHHLRPWAEPRETQVASALSLSPPFGVYSLLFFSLASWEQPNTSWAHEPGTLVKIWQETCIWEPSALKNHNNFKKSLQKYIPLDHLRHFLISGKYIKNLLPMLIDVVVQSTSCIWFFATPRMDSSRAGSSILHCLPEFASIHVH